MDQAGNPITMAGYIRDITEQEIAKEKAKEQEIELHIDSLTQVYSRRYFDEFFDEHFRHTKRSGGFTAMAMIDIDCFKQYNDNYGHHEGDVALKEVAAVLHKKLRRDEDYLFRVGGEEFAVIFTAKEYSSLKTFVQSLVQSVESLEIPFPHTCVEGEKHVTISLGAVYTDCKNIISSDDLYEEVDRLLYLAKENGRNRKNSFQTQKTK